MLYIYRYVVSVGWDKHINIFLDSPDGTSGGIHHVQHPQPKWPDDLVKLPSTFSRLIHLASNFSYWLITEQRTPWGYPLRCPVSTQSACHVQLWWWNHRMEHGLWSHILSSQGSRTSERWGQSRSLSFWHKFHLTYRTLSMQCSNRNINFSDGLRWISYSLKITARISFVDAQF